MTDFLKTTAQERMDLLSEISKDMHGTIMEWCERFESEALPGYTRGRLRYMDDGTVLVELDGADVMTIAYGVEVVAREYAGENHPTGDLTPKTWETVPAGWFVQHPQKEGTFFEVLKSTREGKKQSVTLRVDGLTKTWPRDPEGVVFAKPGTQTTEMDNAIGVLGGAFGDTKIVESGGFEG